MQPNKGQYGLIRLGKSASKATNSSAVVQRPSIFDESDSDSESNSVQYHQSSNSKKSAQNRINEAIQLDPNIFQYDEIYEEIQTSNKPNQPKTKAENKPRYIQNLLKSADLRKKEQELRFERKIQKEREQEGDEFQDKEAFVTSAYLEKVEERNKLHEELKKQEAIEDILDVTKQNDMNAFYRSLYKNTLTNPTQTDESTTTTEQSITFNKPSSRRNKANIRERNDVEDETQEDESVQNKAESKESVKKTLQESQEEPIIPKCPNEEGKTPLITDSNVATEVDSHVNGELEMPKPKPKIDRAQLIEKIFTKRTVGEVFHDARQRYLDRKASRVA